MLADLLGDINTGILSGLIVEALKGAAAAYVGPDRTRAADESGPPEFLQIATKSARAHLLTHLDIDEAASQCTKAQLDAVKSFLLSPESLTVMEHIFAAELVGRASLHRELLDLELKLGLQHHGAPSNNDELRDSLLMSFMAVAKACVEEIEESSPSLARGLRGVTWELSIDTQLTAINLQLRELAHKESRASTRQVKAFREAYTKASLPLFSRIQPPNLDGADPVPIDQIYVTPTLDFDGTDRDIAWLMTQRRAVILGDPGGGKTTLSTAIAYRLLTGSIEHPLSRGTSTVLPLVVTLRDYAAANKLQAVGLVDHMAALLHNRCHAQATPEVLDWLLATGQLFVIFDGLDELLDPSFRQAMADTIESFAALHDNTRILVTSRRVGYAMAPLNREAFIQVSLGEFTYEDTTLYVRKWFELAESLTGGERSRVAEQFLAESALVQDLRSNPLMLGLMCTVYRTEGYIPRNRPDVLEKCARLLFDRWDRRRNLIEPLEFESHINAALAYVASWIYQNADLQSGVTERRLVAKAADYLHARRYAEREDAEQAAQQFIDFCKGRGWVFTDVGLTPSGERLFQFTHRTFLEYFTAYFLCRTLDLDRLLDELLEHIRVDEWDVVAQLAVQIKTRDVEEAPDAALRYFLEHAENENDDSARIAVFSFAARTLSFLIPYPKEAERAAKLICDEYLRVTSRNLNISLATPMRLGTAETVWGGLITPLLGAARENRVSVATGVRDVLTETWQREDHPNREAAAAASWALITRLGESAASESKMSESLMPYRSDLLDLLMERRHDWTWAAVVLLYEPEVAKGDVLAGQPPETFFVGLAIPGTNSGYVAPAQFLCRSLLQLECSLPFATYDWATREESHIRSLVERAQEITTDPEALDELYWLFDVRHSAEASRGSGDVHAPYSRKQMEAYMSVFACLLEFADRVRRLGDFDRLIRRITTSSSLGHLELMRSAIIQRYVNINVDDSVADASLPKSIREWAAKRRSFLVQAPAQT